MKTAPFVATAPVGWLFWVGTVALALNLRLGLTAVAPILPELRSHLGLSTVGASILTALPVACFGVFSIVAAPLGRRFGEERVLSAAIAASAVGLLLRGLRPHELLFVSTFVVAGAIGVENILLSSLIKRRHPQHAGALVGVYLLCLSGGSILGSALTVPILHASGGSLGLALGIWSAPAALAFLLWSPQLKYRTVASPSDTFVGKTSLLRSPVAWQVTSFMAIGSLRYYALMSWLPTLLRGRGLGATEAGLIVGLINVGSAAACISVPTLAHRRNDQRRFISPTIALCAIGLALLLYAPVGVAGAGALIAGLGEGSCLALSISFVLLRSPNASTAASLSAMTQGFGYAFAALGPFGVGLIHGATHSWTAAFAVLFGATAAQWRIGILASRPVSVPVV